MCVFSYISLNKFLLSAMRKPDTALQSILLTAAVVLLAGSSWAVKSWQQVTATAINGTAFYDCNASSVRDNNESPFANMRVFLNGRTTLGDSVNLSTTTDNVGNYGFVGVGAGMYKVKFGFPNGATGLSFTTKNTAINGSDVNPDGATDPLSIDGLADVQGVDVGIIDRVAPVVRFVNPLLLSSNNGDTITVECDNLPNMNAFWAAATDNSGQAVNIEFIDFATSTSNCLQTGYITILNCIFRATDACGNAGERNIFIKIKDSTPPILRGIPTDLTVNTTRGEQIPTVPTSITATDNCTQTPSTIGFQTTETLNTCGKIITRTWTSTDDCGNISRASQRITVISDATCGNMVFPSDTIRLVLSRNTVLDTCLTMPLGSVISNIQHCSSGPIGANITLTASNCLRVDPSVNFVGLDTFCARVCDVNGQNCRDIKLILNVQAARFTACNILGGRDNINLMPTVCGQNACYCIVGTTNIRDLTNDYTVIDNGRPYDGGFSGCQFDTIFSYNYFTVPEMGTRGPYSLDTWQVNGRTRQIASFPTIQTLVDSMNTWDPMGNWRVDAARFLIYGGDMRIPYGQMRISRLANLSFGLLELNTGLISNGVKLCFSTGNHEIIFQNNVTGCADTLRANIFCENDRRAPIAVNDRVSTPKNTPVRVAATLNDTLNGVFESLLAVNQPANGSVGFQNAQTFLYTPNTNFCGKDTFDYRICNAFGLCSTARVFIDIICNNDTTGNNGRRPVAVDDVARTRINTAITLSVLANDTLNGTSTRPLSIVRFQTHGSVNLFGNQVIYTPTSGFCNGLDSFDYEICNASGCDTGRVVVNITCSGDTMMNGMRKPVAVDDAATTRLNTAIVIPVLLNDTLNSPLTGPLSITRFQMHGTVNIAGGLITYTPILGFCGSRDTFDYEICNANGCDTASVVIEITCGSDTTGGNARRKPVAVDDQFSTRINTSLAFAPLANDSLFGVLSRPLSIIGAARHGIAVIMGSQIMYMPEPNFCGGNDTLNYEICNINGCDTGRLVITINCDTTIAETRKPKTQNDFATTQLGRPVTIAVLTNDSTFGALTRPVTVIRSPNRGNATVLNNQIVYAPNPNFCGSQDSLTYEICNVNGCDTSKVYILIICDTTNNGGGSGRSVVAVNDNITTLKNTAITFVPTINDTIRTRLLSLMVTTLPRNGAIAFRGLDTLLYTPNLNFCGRDTIGYTICDTSFNCSNAFIYINVSCDTVNLNGQPVAVPDYATTRKRTPIRINILANDTLNGTLDSIRIIRLPSRGIAALGNDNVITYSTDTCGFTDTLIYRICNRNGCDTALVTIKVSCQTDTTANRLLPIAINDNAQTPLNQSITISVLTNDTLNGVLTGRVGIISRPRFGFALVNGNNQIVYTPQNNFCGGRDTLSYEICNANGCDTAVVYINVICDSLTATRPPIAVFDVATTRKNTPIRIAILTNDTLNGTLDSIKIIRSPLLGIASLDINNILTYTPDSCGFTDSLIYRICNRNGCDTAIVFVKVPCDSNITNVLLPVAVFDTVTTAFNQLVTIRVILNDTLRGADTFRITKRPIHGLAIFDANRQIAYQPELNYCGNDTLIYEICNTRGCDTALVFIKINCAPLPTLRPVAVDDKVKTVINTQVDFVILGNDTLRGARFGEMVSPPSHGTLLIMPDSVAMYKPDKEFCGRDSFLYRLCNNVGCDTALVTIEVSCGDTVEVFRGFSPNGDFKNDRFVIRGIENYPNSEVVIFNRWGNEIFTRKAYRNEEGWDGTWNEKFVPDGTYFYCIRLNNASNKQITGYIQLVR